MKDHTYPEEHKMSVIERKLLYFIRREKEILTEKATTVEGRNEQQIIMFIIGQEIESLKRQAMEEFVKLDLHA